ncbi:hypothetical protein RGUI_1500 [Rhodovulum sp. P5]|uniref:hypothetical protein n=1 Tax=Rhodovulum sp. P5 TaxID=1564506 RepID=UPI0009C26CB3|nr:hypothetical protein [Rhodovulum sp. P5]ARE39641.1 hypothetical protein RGUI_1500 [Rhodovulum sp. P5]
MADKYIWDNWLPKLATKDRVLTDTDFGKPGASTTPFSDMLGFACVSTKKSNTELMSGPIVSEQMGWELLNYDYGEGNVILTTGSTPLSSRMGWSLLADRQYYGVAETSR